MGDITDIVRSTVEVCWGVGKWGFKEWGKGVVWGVGGGSLDDGGGGARWAATRNDPAPFRSWDPSTELRGSGTPPFFFLGLVGPPQNGTYFVRGLSGDEHGGRVGGVVDEEGAGWWAGALDPSRGLGMARGFRVSTVAGAGYWRYGPPPAHTSRASARAAPPWDGFPIWVGDDDCEEVTPRCMPKAHLKHLQILRRRTLRHIEGEGTGTLPPLILRRAPHERPHPPSDFGGAFHGFSGLPVACSDLDSTSGMRSKG